MKTNFTILLLISLIFISSSLYSETQYFRREAKCAVFMHNGDVRTDIINYMSTGVNKMGFENSSKISLFDIWMMNFESNKWDFPKEREQLGGSLDTIFLKNGRIIKDKVRSYSTRRRVFYLRDNREIYVAKVKRIYFCCNKLPAHYARQTSRNNTGKGRVKFVHKNGQTFKANLAWVRGNGRYLPLKNGREIRFGDLRRIEFAHHSPPSSLNPRSDSIVLKNGRVINQSIVSYDSSGKVFKFKGRMPVHIDQIAAVYFGFTRPIPHRRAIKRVRQ